MQQQIADWLGKLGMSEYAQRFAEHDIDIEVLQELTDADFDRLGVSIGHRRKLLKALAAGMPNSVVSSASKSATDFAERRQVTVMFSDLVGSTALSARMDPEDLREVISAYQKAVAETVQRFGGFVAKYMGDGVLVYFGYPQAHEDDAERAVQAAQETIASVAGLKTRAPLQTRIGIATGLVVVGDLIGTGSAQEQAVVGETPNLAARLQVAATPGTIAINSVTRRLLGGLFEFRDFGGIEAKGFADRVQAYEVVRPSMVGSRFKALRTATTPLVGRDEQVDLLLRRWEQVKAGQGCVVLISGEPGIGKSRLAETIVERLGGKSHTRLRYFCSSHHQDSALYPSIVQLERAAGFRREDTAEQRLAKLEAVLSKGTNDLNDAVPLLADLLAIPTGDRYPPLNLTPQKRKEKTLHVQLAQLEGLAARQPLLTVWEDVHWSDPTTRESLDLFIDRISTLRVMMILTFRPELTPPWLGRSHVALLYLDRLPPQQRAEMIVHVTGGKPLPKEIANHISDRTDGVPLFIEELTKSVVESGLVKETDGQYAVTGPEAPIAIPATLQASLLARLDRLAPIREVAQIGAALGRSFSHELISAVAEMPQHELNDALEHLVRSELMFREGTPPDAEYTFKHALVQDVAYGTLLRSRRQQIHTRIAATLQNQFLEIAIAQPALVAQHCSEAGQMEKAAGYWLKASQAALARSATIEAASQSQKGLDLLTSMPANAFRQQQELDLRITLGRALIATRGYGATLVGETYARARSLAEQLDLSEYFFPLLYGQCVFHHVRGEHKLALSLARRMEQIGQTQNDAALALLGHILEGSIRLHAGEFTIARDVLAKSYTINGPTDRAAYRARCASVTAEDPHVAILSHLAVTFAYLGFVDQARSWMSAAFSEARQLGHLYSLGMAFLWACWIECSVGSPSGARAFAEDAISLSKEHGFPYWLAWGLMYRGWSMTMVEELEDGHEWITKGLSAHQAAGSVVSTPFALTLRAEVCGKLGRTREGLDYLTEAEAIIEAANDRFHEAESHRVRGDLLKGNGDLGGAEVSYQKAITVAKQQSAKILELRASSSLARLWGNQGKRAEARDLLAPIYGWFTEGFDTPVLQDAKALLDTLA